MNIDHATVIRWSHQLGHLCLAPAQANQRLQPNWRGFLGIDGKTIHGAGRPMACLLAVDIPTVDIVHWELTDAEDEVGCRRFLTQVGQQMPSLRGLVSDLGKGRVWLKLIAQLFPGIPHQACVIHFDRYVLQTLPQSQKNKHYEENQLLQRLIKDLLYATQFHDAEEIFLRLMRAQELFKADFQRTVLRSLRKHFDLLTAHFHTPDLDRTNNVTENVIKQLDRKLFLLSDFQNPEAAQNFLKLWFMGYRFKRFSGSQYDYRNGLSPLQLAGVDTRQLDWLNFALSTNN